ncbi:MAG: folylpolyglutamate synthase/dihydrofolate synthase family protein [Pseudomonadota bacterium]|nr:folylpolyglutamate synthase/dihydrofolate synthase family protein [Pseudomonadota bacterium]
MDKDPDFLIKKLDKIRGLNKSGIDLGLSRVESLLKELGDPHKKIPPVIHVAGTNGKGSVIAMLRSILEELDFTTHVFTSPHLVSYCERIRISGEIIKPDYFSDLIDIISQKNSSEAVTFFEFITVLAFLAFSKNPADFVLLETGLGGRLDATNVIEKPLITIITKIGIDHQKFLGEKIAEIAYEKAGIMKKNVTCLTAKQEKEALMVIEQVSKKLDLSLIYPDKDWSIIRDVKGYIYSDHKRILTLPEPSLPGSHQIDNMGVSVAAISYLNLYKDEKSLSKALLSVEWPGRCQKIYGGPIYDLLNDNWELWLDGGHNLDAAKALSKWMEDYPYQNILIFGIGITKDASGFLSIISRHANIIRTVSFKDGSYSFKPEELAKLALEKGFTNSEAKDSVYEAAKSLIPLMDNKKGRIIVCGSLYLVGEVLEKHF